MMDIENLTYKTDHLVLNNIKINTSPGYMEFLDKMLENITPEITINQLMATYKRELKIAPKKAEISLLYKYLVNTGKIKPNYLFEEKNIIKEIRSSSGVLVITVFMSDKPNGNDFTCQWDCSFCPSEPGQPKSYLSDEPGVQRGKRNKFDPVDQFNERASTHFINGHTVDKIELLILGGTFHSYPIDYRKDFITKLLYAANTFFDTDKRPMYSHRNEVLSNEHALARIIGITIETRPDCINKETLRELRNLEVTRIQMGLQHTSNDVLKRNNRGHQLKHAIRGIQMAMNNGFKVDIHIMPNMPGSSYQKDKDMFELILNAPYLQADQWKLYPTQVTPFTQIEKEYADGSYVPYPSDDMFELLLNVKTRIHRWIRNNRIVRDFPKQYDLVGNITTNMRQDLHKELIRRGQRCLCIRCVEVRNKTESITRAKMVVRLIERELCCEKGVNQRLHAANLKLHDEGVNRRLHDEGVNQRLHDEGVNRRLHGIYKYHYRELDKHKSKNYFISFESCDCKHRVNTSMMPQFVNEYITLDVCRDYVINCFNKLINNKLEWTGCCNNNTLYGFLRLRIMESNPDACYEEFSTRTAFVRELHVYGTIQKVGNHNKNTVQHFGFGKKLLKKAEQLARENNCDKIAIISGVGVRKYYEKHGYRKTTDGKYMVKEFDKLEWVWWWWACIILCIIVLSYI